MRQDTLVFLVNDDTQELLLAMKKRGFGVGKLNGVGGKVQAGETIEAAAVREAQEEALVRIQEKDLVKVAELAFHFKDKPEWSINYWLPMVLRGDYVQAEFNFNNDGSELLLYKINGSKN